MGYSSLASFLVASWHAILSTHVSASNSCAITSIMGSARCVFRYSSSRLSGLFPRILTGVGIGSSSNSGSKNRSRDSKTGTKSRSGNSSNGSRRRPSSRKKGMSNAFSFLIAFKKSTNFTKRMSSSSLNFSKMINSSFSIPKSFSLARPIFTSATMPMCFRSNFEEWPSSSWWWW